MRSFRHLSIKWKLKLIIMLTSGIALLFASGTLMVTNIATSRKIIRDDLYSLARVIGTNSVGAIVFSDPQTAENNLGALHAKPDVTQAVVYDRHGNRFATYVHEQASEDVTVPALREAGHYYEGKYLFVYSMISQWNDVIGSICIQFDLTRTRREAITSAMVFTMIVCTAFLITWVLSSYLQQFISEPIIGLTRIAGVVSEKKDFSIRAEKQAEDEIGVLIDVFNGMLSRIQSRDEELQKYREHLEEQVANRTVELREANQELRSAKDAAEAANRAKSEFLANMSHEIRTPMNTVLGFTDLLQSQISDEKQKSYLTAISSSGKGLLTLINGILDLSKIEAGKMELQNELVNLHAVFDEIRTLFELQAREKGIDFTAEIDTGIPDSLMLDEVRLKQILFNLIGNAVKFTEKGYVRIAVKKQESQSELSEIGLLITVEDSGIGIPKQFHGEIFKAFKQKDGQSTKRFGGTGLGLSITKRLVEMMDGSIDVNSEENMGSRFRISLPHVQIATGPVAPEKEEPAGREEPLQPIERIDPDSLSEVIELLESQYMQIWTETRKNKFFNEIGSFASYMIQLGSKYKIAPLKSYGEDLNTYVERFDVENMNAALDAYTQMIDKIKQLGTDYKSRKQPWNRQANPDLRS